MLSPMNEGAGPEGDRPNGSTQTPRYFPRRRPSSACARSATKLAIDQVAARSASAITPRRHSAENALPASSTTASGTSCSWRFIALPRISR